MAEDEDILRGMEELQQKENKQLQEIKQTFTPREQKQVTIPENPSPQEPVQPQNTEEPEAPEKKDEKKEDEPNNQSSLLTYGVIGAALIVAGVSYLRYARK